MRPVSRRRRRAAPAIIGVIMVVLLAGAGGLVVRARRANQQRVVVTPELVRLTSSSDATVPAISPDGSRIAFAAQRCDAASRCTFSLLVQEIGAVDTLSIASGAATIHGASWSPDGRFLLLDATFDSTRGSYLLSAITPGTPRLIGCCRGRFLVDADSILLAPAVISADSFAWLRIVTAADGVTRDSIRIASPAGELTVVPSPNGHLLATTAASSGKGSVTQIVNRHGAALDSMATAGQFGIGDWLADGQALIYSRNVPGNGDRWELVYQRVDSGSGRLQGEGEPVVQRSIAAGGGFSVARKTNALVFADGPLSTSVLGAQRPDLGSNVWKVHALKQASGIVAGLPSPDGRQVLLGTAVSVGRNLRSQLSVIPFDSGAERLVGAPMPLPTDWNWPGAAPAHPLVLIPGSRGKDQIVDIDVVAGTTRIPLSFPDSTSEQQFEPLAAGAIVTADAGSHRIVVMSADGSVEREIPHPLDPQRLAMATSPDGADLAVAGYSVLHDSVLVYHVRLADGTITQVAAFPFARSMVGLRWLVDGSIVVALNETRGTAALFTVRGGTVRRLGMLPWGGNAKYEFSADGLRLVVAMPQSHADVWLIRNFGKLLPH